MKNRPQSTLHIFVAASLLMTLVFTLGDHPVGARSDSSQAVQPEAQDNEMGVPTNQVIVKYKTNADLKGANIPSGNDRVQMLSDAGGIPLEYVRVMSGNAHVLRLPARLSFPDVMDIARRMQALPDIEYAEPDGIMYPSLVPNDPQYGNQWHYFASYGINMLAAWDFTTGSSGIKIAVVDTGITDHADLAGRWVGGYDFITDAATANDGGGRDNDPRDPGNWITSAESSSGAFAGCPVTNSSWHGTHVAGTIGAAGNNNTGVAGINWVSQIVPVRVLGKCGGFLSDITDGMRWAAGLPVSGIPVNSNPAKVLNLSLGGPGICSTTYQNAINAINAAGSVIVVAAGNNGSNLNTNSFQPANCTGIITVAATDRGGDRAFYSNYGTAIKISAPGGETNPTLADGVLSTVNTGTTLPVADTYAYKHGTSMAAPHVTGVVSLMLSLDPTLNLADVLQILQSTAQDFPIGSTCTQSICGPGIVDAAGAVNAVGGSPETATPSQTPTNTSTPTATHTFTSTATRTPTATPSQTSTATATITQTATNKPTFTPTSTFIKNGADTTGVFRPSNGALYLKNSNTTGFADVQINYGIGGDYPVVGDWDGNGTVTIGVYRNGSFYLRNSNTIGFADLVFPFGAPGDQPVAGDWNGDGIDTIGVYRNGTFFLGNENFASAPDIIFALGIPGDVGIAGDWDGDGLDSTGVFRPSNGALYLKYKNETGFADLQINYGIGGDKPVTGDWDGDGIDTIGVYRNGQFYLRNSNTIGFADWVFALGIPGDHPIAGNWDGLP